MTDALKRPPKKDPQKRTDSPTLPPSGMSRHTSAIDQHFGQISRGGYVTCSQSSQT